MQIDHNEYPKRLRNKSHATLVFIIDDCRAALQAMPEGYKAGYYQDEINYCGMEIQRRRNQEN